MEAVKRYGILTVGSVVLGISDYIFKFQNHFSFGGVSGIAVIMSGLLGGSASTYTFVINMLLLVVAFVLLGKEVAMRSAYVSVLYSVTLEVIQYVWPMSKPLTNQPVHLLHITFLYGAGTPFMPVEQSQTFQVIKITVLHIEIVFVDTI